MESLVDLRIGPLVGAVRLCWIDLVVVDLVSSGHFVLYQRKPCRRSFCLHEEDLVVPLLLQAGRLDSPRFFQQ